MSWIRLLYSFVSRASPQAGPFQSAGWQAEWLCYQKQGSRCWWNGCQWPVLKHGPRSLTYMRVFGCLKPWVRNESEGCYSAAEVGTLKSIFFGVHHRPIFFRLREIRVRAYLLGPERWWTMPGQDEVRGNSDGGPKEYWRANRFSDLGIGAKD